MRYLRDTRTKPTLAVPGRGRAAFSVMTVVFAALTAAFATFAAGQLHAQTSDVQAAVPGGPRNLAVTVSSQDSEKLLVSWETPASDGGSAITGYKIQYKLSDGATFDHELAVSSDLAGLPRRVAQVTNGSGREHTVRVVATNAVGDGPPSAEATATPLTPVGHLRVFIKKEIVEKYGAAHPWLGKAWQHMNRPGFNLSVAQGMRWAGTVGTRCHRVLDSLSLCKSSTMAIHPNHARSASVITHEMAHVYTLTNGLASIPGPLGVAHVYFDRLNLGSSCPAEELYADIVTKTVLPQAGLGYWTSCNGGNATRTQEAMAVVRSALRGEMPTWFGTTYGSSDPDLELFWSHAKDMSAGKDRTAVMYQLRNAFGGYCDYRTAQESVDGSSPLRNPWRDGGCVPYVVDGGAAVNGNTITLLYNEALDETKVPTPGYGFKVWVGGTRGDTDVHGGTVQTVSAIAVGGRKVTLTLASPVTPGAEVRIDYVVPDSGRSAAISDASGNLAENFYSDVIDNLTPALGAPSVTGLAMIHSPRSGTYGIGSAIDVLVTYSSEVIVDTTNGALTLNIQVGSKIRQATHNASDGRGSRRLVFRYRPVVEGEEDVDGVSVPSGYIALNGGTMVAESSGVAAARTHSGLAAQDGHLVETQRPTLSSATVDGSALTLTFSEVLADIWLPPPAAFAVTVAGSARTVDAVAVSERTMTLTLSSAVTSGEAVMVGYTQLGASFAHRTIRDAAGNPVANFADVDVTNERGVLPVVSILASTTPVTEGTAAAFTLARTEGTDAELTVEVSVAESGAALSGTPPTQVTFAAGSASALLSVATEDDEAVEDASTVTATVSSGTGYTVDGASGSAEVVVEDNDAAPVATTASPIEVAENATAVATLTATDEDTAAEDLSWSIPSGADGGADRAKFALTAGGELTFGSAKDFEAPDDADTDGEYEVTVRVTDGSNPVDAALVVRLSDVDDTAPTLSSTSVDGEELTLTFNETLDEDAAPPGSSFTVTVAGSARTVDAVAVSEKVVTLTLSSAVVSGETVTVGYTVPTGADATPVKDAAGNPAATFANAAVTNATAALPVVSIAASTTPVTEGTAAAFTLARTGATDAELTVQVSVSESGAALSGTPSTQVTFAAGSASATLSVATEDDEAVEDASTVTATVSSGTGYTVDGASGSAEVVVEDDDAAPVVTTASPIEVAENATVVATLTATDEDTAGEDLSWSIPSGADGAKFALTTGGELTFGSAKDFEAPDDADTDGEYEITVRVTDGSNPVDAALVVRLSDVDDMAPTLSSASVDGDALTLTFSEALDGDSEPPAFSFAVTVAGSARTVDAVAVSEKVVTLTLSSAVVSGETVTVGYTVPTGADATPVKDAAGNSVATFANAKVTNETAALPVVSIAASTTPVTEGTAAAFTLTRTEATDAELTVEVSVAESGAALSGTPATQVTFAAGSASATLSVATEDDEAVEDASTVTATVSSGTGYTVDGASGSAEVVVEDDDAVPVVTTASPIEVAENATAVATLSATDEDTAVGDLSWSIPSGADGSADGAKFALTAGGELTFGSAKDYEAPDDSDTDGEYEVTVRVTDGSNPVDAALMVRLSDVRPTASFEQVPERHDGTAAFHFQLHFSPEPAGLSYKTVGGGLLEVTGATVTGARRLTKGSNLAWEVTAEPIQTGDIGISLPVRPCSETSAICINGEPLAQAASAIVPGPTVVSIAASTTPVTEGTAATFTLSRTEATDAELTVEVSVTESEAALSGTPPTQVTFTAGSASATLSVATEDDEAVEDASTVTATVSSGTGYTVDGASGSADVVVEDDDAAPVVTTASPIEVAENATAVATLSATDEDTAAGDLSWSIPSGADGGADGAKFALTAGGELTFQAAKDYEAPDDSDTDGDYEVAVRVTDGSNPVDTALVVRLSDVDDTAPTLSSATVDGDALTLTFSEALDGDSEPPASSFAVAVAGSARTVDAVAVSEKVVRLTLTSAVVSGETVTVGYTVPTGADAPPVKDAAGNSVATFANAEVTNETAALPVVSIAASTTPVPEGTAAAFTLARTEATDAELTVQVSVAESGAALSGTPPTQVTFAAGSASATLSVATEDDEAVEDASTVTATVSSGTGYTVDGISGSTEVVVEDDDTAPVMTTASPIEVAENGTAVATLTATDEDTAGEDLSWSIPSGADGGADGAMFALTAGGELTFQAAKDYEAPDDADTDGDYEVTVRVTDGSNPVDAALVVRLSDVDDTAPTLSSATVDGDALTLTFSEALDGDSEPPASSFAVTVAGSARSVDAVAVSEKVVRLTLSSAVVSGETVTVGYTVPTGADATPVKDSAGNSVATFANAEVTNETAALPVVSIAASTTPVPEGTAAAFTLARTEATDAELTVQVSVAESGAALSGTPPTQVTFAAGSASATLSVATEDDEAVEDASTVTAAVSSGTGYTVDGASGSADVVVEDDDAAPVVTTASPIEVAENATAVATLSATDEDTAAGDLSWSIPSGADGGADGAKFALTAGGELTFQAAKDYEAPDDSDTDGDYEVAVRVTDGSNPVDTALVVRLSDVDDTAPTLSSATVDGDALTLTFSEALDGDSEPPASSFAVAVAGSARTVDAVAVSEKVVRLTLTSAVVSGETVTVGYTVPTGADAPPVKDAAGNSVATFANAEVTNETAALPVVSIAASTTPVPEGTAAAFTLARTEATDAELTVQVSVAESGAALSGTPPTQVTFAAGSASATLSVATEDDEAVEDASTVTAAVSSGTGYTVDGASGSVEVVVEDDDAAPVVTTASPIEVAENGTAVATLAATDEDTAGEDLSWSIPSGADGGADEAMFALTAGGELTFQAAKDYESPDDADTDGDYEVTVRVTDGSNPVDTALVVRLSDVDDTAPTLLNATVDGDELTLTFSEALDGDSIPPESSFAVTVAHGPRTVDARIRSDKGVTRVGRSAHNVNEVTVSGKMVMLTLSSAVVSVETVTVGYTVPTGADATPVKDAAGNPAATFANAEVKNETAALPVVSIAASTMPVTEGTAAAFTLSRTEATDAELTVEVSVSESEAVMSAAPPTQVTFAAGSASATLSVATEDDEAVEDASAVTATVSSGTGYTVDGASGSAEVVVEDDDAAPVVTTVFPIEVAENATAVATLTATDEDTAGEDLSWSIPADADGGADGSKFALTTGGELTFKAAKDFEAPDDADTDGEYEVTVRVTDGSNPVDAALVVRLSDVDDMPPTVTGVSVTSDPGADRRWTNGDRIEIEVQFSEAVAVDVSGGTPTLKFWTYGVAHRAAYSSGSGTSTLTFDWEVSREGTRGGSPSRAMVAENGLELHGATIRNEAGVDAELGFTVTPMITSVRIASPPSRNRWAPGEMVSVSFAFSAVVTVDTEGGIPTLGLQLVAGARNVAYAGGSGTRTLTFAYPVTDSDGNVRLVRVLDNALSLNGGTIENEANEDADLSYRGYGRITAPDAIGIAIDDARALEGEDETITFRVRFAPARNQTVSVSWATEDGTATAGEDYSASQGTVSFAPGETEKTIEVAILDDPHDEGEETFTVRLSDASPSYTRAGGRITRPVATGTIVNTDPMPQAWLARFGRTVAEQVIEAAEGRFDAHRSPGAEVSLAGIRLDGASAEAVEALEAREAEARLDALSRWLTGDDDEADEETAHSRVLTGRDFLTGTSFALTGGTAVGGFASVWGRGAVSNFDGRDGDLTLNGEVESTMLGADFTRETAAVGLMVMHSRGEGSYRGQGEGTVDSSLTGLYPYGRYALNERVTVWGAAGYGEGELTLTPKDASAIETDMDLTMGAAGVRGVALEAPADGGIELSVTSDAMAVRTSSEEVSGGEGGKLAGADGDVTRFRLGLEGTWRGMATGSGGELTPRVEFGLRHDGGDAETGFGVDAGAGLIWVDPASGLSAELSARGLLTHESDGFRDRGIAGSLAWDSRPDSNRGFSLTLNQTMGGAAAGGMDALLGRETLVGLAANEEGGDLANRRLDVGLGYGFGVFRDRFTVMPEVGLGLSNGLREYRLGWQLGLQRGGPVSMELALDAARHEAANDRGEAVNALMVRGLVRW